MNNTSMTEGSTRHAAPSETRMRPTKPPTGIGSPSNQSKE